MLTTSEHLLFLCHPSPDRVMGPDPTDMFFRHMIYSDFYL